MKSSYTWVILTDHIIPCLPASGRQWLISLIVSYCLGQELEIKPLRKRELSTLGPFTKDGYPSSRWDQEENARMLEVGGPTGGESGEHRRDSSKPSGMG